MNSAPDATVLHEIVTRITEALTLADAAGLSLLAAGLAQALTIAVDEAVAAGVRIPSIVTAPT